MTINFKIWIQKFTNFGSAKKNSAIAWKSAEKYHKKICKAKLTQGTFYSEKVDVTYESNPLGIFIYMSRHVMVRESLRDITAHIWRFTPNLQQFFAPSLRQKTPLDTLPPGFLVTNWAKSGKVWFCLGLTLNPRLNQACKVYLLKECAIFFTNQSKVVNFTNFILSYSNRYFIDEIFITFAQ